jgi:hypothetical protein
MLMIFSDADLYSKMSNVVPKSQILANQRFETETKCCVIAIMWTIELCIRYCDICKDFRVQIRAINSR